MSDAKSGSTSDKVFEQIGSTLGVATARVMVGIMSGGIVALIATAYILISEPAFKTILQSPTGSALGDEKLEELDRRLARFEKLNFENLNYSVSAIDRNRIISIEKKQKILENSLQSSIEKSLSIAMMRRDLDDFEKTYRERSLILENRIEKLYEIFLWIVGSIITILAAFIGLIGSRRAPAK